MSIKICHNLCGLSLNANESIFVNKTQAIKKLDFLSYQFSDPIPVFSGCALNQVVDSLLEQTKVVIIF